MNTKSKKSFPLWEFLLLGIALTALTLIVRGSAGGWLSGDETTLATATSQMYPPPPTFGEAPDSGNSLTPTRTATPINPTIDPNWTPPPTETPIFISELIDLSPDLAEYEEYYFLVQRETGAYVLYTLGPMISNFREDIPQSVIEQLPLGPNDVLIWGSGPMPDRHSIAEIMGYTPTPTLTPTETLNPYPFGWTPTPTATPSPTINPYP